MVNQQKVASAQRKQPLIRSLDTRSLNIIKSACGKEAQSKGRRCKACCNRDMKQSGADVRGTDHTSAPQHVMAGFCDLLSKTFTCKGLLCLLRMFADHMGTLSIQHPMKRSLWAKCHSLRSVALVFPIWLRHFTYMSYDICYCFDGAGGTISLTDRTWNKRWSTPQSRGPHDHNAATIDGATPSRLLRRSPLLARSIGVTAAGVIVLSVRVVAVVVAVATLLSFPIFWEWLRWSACLPYGAVPVRWTAAGR